MALRRGRKPVSANPMCIGELIRRLNRTAQMWGDDTPVGIMLSGSGFIMPVLEVQCSDTKARCTIIANFSEAGQNTVTQRDLSEPSAGIMPTPGAPPGPTLVEQKARMAKHRCPMCVGELRQNEESMRQHRYKCIDCGHVCIIP
jgi:hypothetical protein